MQNVIDWVSNRTLRVWRYGIGHSQLLLVSSQGDRTGNGLGVHFEAVEYMRLVPTFKDLRITTADKQQALEVKASGALPSLSRPLLVLTLHHDDGVGMVACSRLRIGEFHGEPTSDFATVQHQVTASP
ncbi:hypothetical protein ACFWAR_01195 [Streptomyces sp. NPDC059917]|uniref:hypothetical protein n=1 Tax=Streptomyces sp. NPDC059917 TaxID=3347002 RepID=UPI0036620E66